jgi:hypothetical protein
MAFLLSALAGRARERSPVLRILPAREGMTRSRETEPLDPAESEYQLFRYFLLLEIRRWKERGTCDL